MTQAPAVVVVSGHLTDPPDRLAPRFPAGEVERVTREVARTLRSWQVGPATTIICGGARGADLIVAEQARELGAAVRICLARPIEEFVAHSVEQPGTDWVARFRALTDYAEVTVLAPPAGENRYVAVNEELLRLARSRTSEPYAIVVWNGREGNGPGGTGHFVNQLRAGTSGPVQVIDPTARCYQARQDAAGPKKLLALDGGGIRGVLSLEILRSIESQLRTQQGRPKLVLADYFDYIGGTSTGAIIATGLALGRDVESLQQRYLTLAKTVFRKRPLPMRLRSIYPDTRLTAELENFFSAKRTLGDPDLQSLLLLVLHNTITDSAWPLSNCTWARYNRADRYLLDKPDRNLDLSLIELLRGSTAAPFYFRPQALMVGKNKFVFQDGGLTPFNNPGLLMYVMATLPEYQLCWPAGPENLLIVSVGTGAAASVHPGLSAKNVGLGFNARNFPSVVMGGASVGQDLLARTFGSTRAGTAIDREFGDRVNPTPTPGGALFSYVRYNADLSDESLIAHKITDAKTRKQIRKLDAVNQVSHLRSLGRSVGSTVDIRTHFRDFL